MESENIVIFKRIENQIKQYGFAIYDIYNWKELCFRVILLIFCTPFVPYIILSLVALLGLGGHTHSGSIDNGIIKWGIIIAIAYIIYYIIGIFGSFILGSRMIYLKNSYIFAGVIFLDIDRYAMENILKKYFLIPLRWYSLGEKKKDTFHFNDPWWTGSFMLIILAGSIFGYVGIFQIKELGLIWMVWLELGIIGTCSLIIILYEKFHPLYAFGNLGEKIQKLTPRIEEQSKKIQSEFQSDMNFRVLSDGFDSLSRTFSEIVSFVLKLERAEKRANKGNLFNSENYINSLRSDIVEPLKSLRRFLEIQRSELLSSQRELTQVRIGGLEPTGNIELQSKRSESLILELTENIGKLDLMIGKMG